MVTATSSKIIMIHSCNLRRSTAREGRRIKAVQPSNSSRLNDPGPIDRTTYFL